MLSILYHIWKQTRLAYEVVHFVSEYNFQKFWNEFIRSYETDSKGRITKLELGWMDHDGAENDFTFDLPPIIKCP
jgi:hypothetical protein